VLTHPNSVSYCFAFAPATALKYSFATSGEKELLKKRFQGMIDALAVEYPSVDIMERPAAGAREDIDMSSLYTM
jgi:hypothetical protein